MSDGKTRRRMNEREWLCFEDGVNWERERIIKLLEPLAKCDDDCDHYGCGTYVAEQAIALIKGEK